MTSISDVHDSAAGLTATSLHNEQVVTGTGIVNGASVDTIPNNAQQLGSAQIYCDGNANGNIAGVQVASLDITIQDAPDNGGVPGVFADVAAGVLMGAADGADGLPANPVITLTGGGIEANIFTMNLPLHRLRRHVRVVSEWTVVAGDSVDYACSAHCGGNVIKPV
jgi:hypothetical protein